MDLGVNAHRESPTIRSSNIRRPLKLVLFGLAAVVLLGLVAPFISVGAYRSQIRKSLEASLGRPVTIGSIHYTLFAGPGFSIDDVIIGEDPRYGIEPCAYVPTLVARVRLDKLLAGDVQFAELRLSDPTLNVVKRSDGTWNIVEILERLTSRSTQSWNILPAIQISEARLNFKFGNRKTVFYMDGADVAAYPEATGKVHVVFSGSPSRTDRSGHGFGMVRGEANWYLKPSTPRSNKLEADLALERSNLSETITLIEGYDIGIHGSVSSHVVVSGPEDALQIRGDLRLEDVHRWDLLPASGEDWHVRYSGHIDLLQHKIQLETVPASSATPSPVSLQVRVNDFLTAPAWTVLAQFHRAPAQNLLPLATRLGLELPAGLKAAGIVEGAVGYSNRSGWNGGLALEELNASLPDGPALSIPSVTLNVSNDRVHIFPAAANLETGEPIHVTGDYVPSSREVNLSVTLTAAPVQSITKTVSSWFGSPPLFPAIDSGLVSGQLRYKSEPPDPPVWTGDFQLSKAQLRPPGVALPVRGLSAHVLLNGDDVSVPRFSGSIADARIAGEYRYRGGPARNERISVQTSAADISQLEKLFSPILGRQDFFSRFRFGRRSLPAWLASRRMEGDAVIQNVLAAGVPLGSLRARFQWAGPVVQVTALQLRMPEGRLSAKGSLNLTNVRPRYSFTGDLADYPWKGGLLNVAGTLITSGLGTDVLQNLRVTGDFGASDIEATPDITLSKLSGRYTLSLDSGWPQLRLTEVEAEENEESWQGTGATDKDGNLTLELANGTRERRIVSTLDVLPPSHPDHVAER
jgi:AsmA protein